MLSAPAADRAWKGMTPSFPTGDASGACPAARAAGKAAYGALLHGDGRPAGDVEVQPWLLLRDRTTSRAGGH
ncbi:hypothetical protein [Streptomyces sp. CA-106110]|uniref:hypothetical protein n=1 Tax=Streptomyces sp. CA-106110 TaxID=3240044 RepID=UPI003D91B77F